MSMALADATEFLRTSGALRATALEVVADTVDLVVNVARSLWGAGDVPGAQHCRMRPNELADSYCGSRHHPTGAAAQ